jgi:hypothetical protein
MSNYDAGHYFLTVLAPVRKGHPQGRRHTDSSHVIALRRDLIAMPTARQDAASRNSPLDSPFARVPGIHFARFFILDDLPYNGRRPSNAVYDLIMRVDLVQQQAVDHLENAWLAMVIDMDAPDGSEASLRACTDRLWQGMEAEFRRIFGHCIGFDDAAIRGPADWFAYLRRCQVTTTMPYNDYWTDAPPPSPLVRLMTVAGALIAMGAGGALALGFWPLGWISLVALAFVLWLLTTVGIVLKLGTTPFPPAPDSDLASILKALYVQNRFTRFAMAQQGQDPEALHSAFGAFVAICQPSTIAEPTQPAGRLAESAPTLPGGPSA